jgi:carbon monoxide dehydrogenase subunit G
MIEITRTRDVPGSPEDVAALVADLERWPEWFALHKGWAGPIPTTAAKGVTFKHKIRVLGVNGEVKWEVTELDPPRRFVLKGKGPSRSNMGVDFRISPREGGSTVAFTATIGGLAIKPIEGVLKGWIEVRADRTVDGLERVLGGDVAARPA